MKLCLQTIAFGLFLLVFLSIRLRAQEFATLTGTVVDPSEASVSGARVTVVNNNGGYIRTMLSNEAGLFLFDSLLPGEYTVEISKSGFNTLRMTRVVLNSRDRQSLSCHLQIQAASPTVINVTDRIEGISSDASSGAVMNQDYFQNLPINGRDANSLVRLAPGVTSPSGNANDIHVNGLRSGTNYYTVDGLSTNTASGGGPALLGGGPGGPGGAVLFGGGPPGGGGPPPGSGGGGGDSPPLDALQEVRVQTSAFAPEFGRSPGAQISMTSRGGLPQFHGSAYEYFRNTDLNANDFFANAGGLPRGMTHQNRFGGTFGGPFTTNHPKTFFFFNYEELHLVAPQTLENAVPDQATRQSSSASLRPFLNAFPIGNGPELSSGISEFFAVTSDPSHSRTGSFRLDHTFSSRMTAFVRYSDTRSGGDSRGSEIQTANMFTTRNASSKTFTGALLSSPSPLATNDLRVNYSLSGGNSYSTMDSFGGAIPLNTAQLFPPGVSTANGSFNLSILGTAGYSTGGRSQNRQGQANIVDGITMIAGTHSYKIGADIRRQTPNLYRLPYSASVSFNGISPNNTGGLLSGLASNLSVSRNMPEVFPVYLNFSWYLQDTWKATARFTLTYGVRWDVNPAPGVRKGPRPFGVTSGGILTDSEPLYHTQWANIGPRVGAAYQIDTTPGHETVLRCGAGIFYDTGTSTVGGAFGSPPYSASTLTTTPGFPIDPPYLVPPAFGTTPYGQVTSAVNNLQAPLVVQFNLMIDHYYGPNQMLSVGYAGTSGTRLLQNSTQSSYTKQYDLLSEVSNGATSTYNSLQVQFRRRLSQRLQLQASWTWGHSLDTASNNFGGAGFASFGGSRGSSDYDIRHTLSVSGSYQIRAIDRPYFRALTKNWYLDLNSSARTGLPFDITGQSSSTSSSSSTGGAFAQVRPDYVYGKAVWISDPHAPGGRRLNPDAFSIPSGFAQGNLGRNALRGFGYMQVDLSLRRQIAATEKIRLNMSAQSYNILNHPAFANPSPQEGAYMASPFFGVATRLLSSGGAYSTGGPRNLEMALRLQF